jgi:hypothetical protein
MGKASEASWTVAVYQDGDKGQSPEMVWALQEMKDVLQESKDPVKTFQVIAQFDTRGAMPRRYDFSHAAPSSPSPSDQERQSRIPALSDFEKRELIDREIQEFSKEAREKARTVVRSLAETPIDPEVICNLIEWARSYDADPFLQSEIREYSKEDPRRDAAVAKSVAEDSAHPRVVRKFIHWARSYDADHFMLVLSGFGRSGEGDSRLGQDAARALGIRELGRVLESVPYRIDVLGLGSCDLGTAEVCYELTRSYEPDKSELPKVSILIGSEGQAKNAGWPYRRILGALLKDNQRSPEAVAKRIVQEYAAYYADYAVAGISVDLAAIDLARFKARLVPAFTKLVAVLQEALELELKEDEPVKRPLCNAVLLAHWEAQSYQNGDHADLYDFCAHLQRRAPKGSPLERFLSLQRQADVVLPVIVGEQPNEELVNVADACENVMNAIESEGAPSSSPVAAGRPSRGRTAFRFTSPGPTPPGCRHMRPQRLPPTRVGVSFFALW